MNENTHSWKVSQVLRRQPPFRQKHLHLTGLNSWSLASVENFHHRNGLILKDN